MVIESDSPPFLKEGGENFDYLTQREGIQKVKKRWWKYGPGAGLLNPIQDVGDKKALYQFFLCNFCKRRS